VEEKLFVNPYEDWLNVFSREKRTNQRCGSRCRCRAQMRRLADLTSRLVLSLRMGVRQRLGNEENGQGRQGESKRPYPVISRLVRHTHVDGYTLLQSSIGRQACVLGKQQSRWAIDESNDFLDRNPKRRFQFFLSCCTHIQSFPLTNYNALISAENPHLQAIVHPERTTPRTPFDPMPRFRGPLHRVLG